MNIFSIHTKPEEKMFIIHVIEKKRIISHTKEKHQKLTLEKNHQKMFI